MSASEKPHGILSGLGISRDTLNIGLKVLADTVVLSFGYTAAYLLRFEWTLDDPMVQSLLWTQPIVVTLKIALLFYFGAYRMSLQVRQHDRPAQPAQGLCSGSSAAVVPYPRRPAPGGVEVIDSVLTILLLGGIRFGARRSASTSPSTRGLVRPANARS